jgi:hypothetical protein
MCLGLLALRKQFFVNARVFGAFSVVADREREHLLLKLCSAPGAILTAPWMT